MLRLIAFLVFVFGFAIAAALPARVTVRRGDTLYVIATRYGLSVAELKRRNNLQNNTIHLGQVLRIAATNKPVTPTPQALVVVVVRSGDSLSKIAQRYGTTVAALRKNNHLKSNVLRVGQRLLLRGTTPTRRYPRLPYSVALSSKRVRGVDVRVVHVNLESRVKIRLIAPRLGVGHGGVSLENASRGAVAAINGGFFHPSSYAPAGDVVRGGKLEFSGRIPSGLAITRNNLARVFYDPTPNWRGVETGLSNGPYILRGGRVVVTPRAEGYRDPAIFAPAQRSAIALVNPQHVLLVSTTGKITLEELARVLQSLGARDGLTLDGGSSTGLVFKGQTLIRPLRRISYGIGVFGV